jgi:hypothetical protein
MPEFYRARPTAETNKGHPRITQICTEYKEEQNEATDETRRGMLPQPNKEFSHGLNTD